MVVADNLAAHALGGFPCNFFTSQKFYGFCNINKSQQNEKIPVSHFTFRTKNAYDNNIIAINEDQNLSHLYGIKENSILNYLNYFHVADCLPPDLAHDLLEGFAVDTASSVIASFIREGLFDLDGLNEIILTFAYSESDKNHKPQLVKVKPLNSLKVRQAAYEMWTLIRLLPLVIGSLIPLGNVWLVYIGFVKIVEILCGTKFTNIDLLLLQDKIDTFFPK